MFSLTYDSLWNMVTLSGKPEDFLHLATEIRRNQPSNVGALRSDDPNTLLGIAIIPAKEPSARISVDGRQLVIASQGTPGELLATNIARVSTYKPGEHTHHEYFEDHPFLSRDSVPLVLGNIG